MKKYVKPQLYMENFALTQHIAGDCAVIMNMAEPFPDTKCSTGKFTFGETFENFFEISNHVCTDCIEGYCYTNSTVQLGTLYS